MRAVAIYRGVDGDIADAVGEGAAVVNDRPHEAGAELFRGVEYAIHFEVLEGGTVGIAEEGGELHGRRHVEGDGVALPVEGAGETLVLDSCHGADDDIVSELHELARVGRVVGDALGEPVPVNAVVDEIRVVACARA